MTHELFTKLRLAAVILSAVAAIVVGVTKVHIVKDVYPTKTKVVRVIVPRQLARTGEMTEGQCGSLESGATQTQVEDQYGLPKGEEPPDEAFSLVYPIRGTSRTCTLMFGYEHGLEHVSLELPLR